MINRSATSLETYPVFGQPIHLYREHILHCTVLLASVNLRRFKLYTKDYVLLGIEDGFKARSHLKDSKDSYGITQ